MLPNDLPFSGFDKQELVPKNIYMCHKTLNHIEIYSQNWKKLNPEWDIKLYDDKMCQEFFLKEYSRIHYDIFNFLQHGPIKADFWRVCVLYKYGGLYVDADIEPLVPLKDYIEEDIHFCTCIIEKNKYNPHFLLANKGDNILKWCIEQYIKNYTNKVPYTYWGDYSIPLIFNKILNFEEPTIYEINDKKYKFLLNVGDNDFRTEHAVCNNIKIFNNRYLNYDIKKHKFKN